MNSVFKGQADNSGLLGEGDGYACSEQIIQMRDKDEN